MPNHVTIDRRSLAFGRALAARVSADPSLIDQARATLARWTATASPRVLPTLNEWAAVLDGPVAGVLAILTGDDERATRLRQSNPFAGLLPAEQRTAILLQFIQDDPPSA
ncbi:MAG: hypothetical protein ACAI43_21100 [Phycisphaerae bacterium]|nr:hypothetical protein [Tepidisphaeraceae bacterium]